jgi:hypothetical protein
MHRYKAQGERDMVSCIVKFSNNFGLAFMAVALAIICLGGCLAALTKSMAIADISAILVALSFGLSMACLAVCVVSSCWDHR